MIKHVTISTHANTQINQSTAILNPIDAALAMVQHGSGLTVEPMNLKN
jgi:hypothetical protein